MNVWEVTRTVEYAGKVWKVTLPGYVGSVREIGIADLEVVRQEILRYEAGEIAHIENVLRGEKRERSHRRAKRTEEVYFTETETTEETERDLESTERFELQTESQETIKQESSFDVGVTVKYGGFVDVEASTKYESKNAREESSRTARNYAQQVTEKTVSKVRERVLERRARTVTEEFEEKNLHSINAEGYRDHTVGIYRWVDKVYEAQICNYGLRTMYEFIIPEPAAFLKYLQTEYEEENITKPIEPTNENENPLEPKDIEPDNFHQWTVPYAVVDISPPPLPEIRVGYTWQTPKLEGKISPAWVRWGPEGFGPEGIFTNLVAEGKEDSIKIEDKDYAPKEALIQILPLPYMGEVSEPGQWPDCTMGPARETFVEVAIADQHIMTSCSWRRRSYSKIVDLDGVPGDIPITISCTHDNKVTVLVNVRCEYTEEAMNKWRLETYKAIITGYLKLKSAYDERMAASEIEGGVVIPGRNPQTNREIEKIELKKSALRLLCRHPAAYYQLLGVGAIAQDTWRPNDLSPPPPVIVLDRADKSATYIQFLEQAFEWEQMVYTFYPYFWARKEQWPDLLLEDDNDPLHARFLRAGAARVVVPVRLGYETSLRYFWATGKPWEGKGPPSVTDEAFVPMLQEIQESQGLFRNKGKGSIAVKKGIEMVEGTGTAFLPGDVGREIVIDGVVYHIAKCVSATQIFLDRAYTGQSNDKSLYWLGVKLVGDPWEVRVPTSLVILNDKADQLPAFPK